MELSRPIQTLTKMGWYLDTSLFLDFIQRNIRVGFDSAEPFDGHTIARIEGVPGKPIRAIMPILKDGTTRLQFELTETVEALQSICLSYKVTYYYSELVLAEVFRHIRKAYPTRNSTEITDWWQAFCFIMRDFRRVELDFSWQQLSRLALNYPIKKNVQDYIHLIASKEKGLAFITRDKLDGQLEELRQSYYSHIYYWPELSAEFPFEAPFKHLPS